jgi:hypothetical protein
MQDDVCLSHDSYAPPLFIHGRDTADFVLAHEILALL